MERKIFLRDYTVVFPWMRFHREQSRSMSLKVVVVVVVVVVVGTHSKKLKFQLVVRAKRAHLVPVRNDYLEFENLKT